MVRRISASEKMSWRYGLRKCIRPLGGMLFIPGHDGMRRVLFLSK
jgi:hypothetical protein